jgi:hypothetical protein
MRGIGIQNLALLVGDALALVFHETHPCGNKHPGEYAFAMDAGIAPYETPFSLVVLANIAALVIAR